MCVFLLKRSAPNRKLSRKLSVMDAGDDNDRKLPNIYPDASNTSSDYLRDLTFLNKKVITTHVNERDSILDNEMKRLQMMATTVEGFRRNRRLRKRTLSERFAVRQRFKRAVRRVIIILSMLEIHKIQVQRMLLKQSENWIHKTFKVSYFKMNYNLR